MQPFCRFLVVVCFFAVAPLSAYADDFARWRVELATAAGPKWSGNLVLTSLRNRDVRGYFVWQTNEKNRVLEGVAGTYDAASGRLSLLTAELRWNDKHRYNMCDYSAKVDQETKAISDGLKSHPSDANKVLRWSGTPLPDSNTPIDAEAETWTRPKTEREQLMLSLSSGYQIGKISVDKRVDAKLLPPLLRANDKNVVSLATEASSILTMIDVANNKTDITEEARQFQAGLIKNTLSQLGNSDATVIDSLKETAKLFGEKDGAFGKAVDKFVEHTKSGVAIQASQNLLRSRMKDYLRKSSPTTLTSQKVGAVLGIGSYPGEKISLQSHGSVVLTNLSNEPLTGVAIVIDIDVNRALLEKTWAQESPHWQIAGVLEQGLGFDKDVSANRLKARKLQIETMALGKGTTVYLGNWPKGGKVEIYAESLGAINHIVEQIGIFVATDAGTIPVEALKRDDMNNAIEKVVMAQRKATQPNMRKQK